MDDRLPDRPTLRPGLRVVRRDDRPPPGRARPAAAGGAPRRARRCAALLDDLRVGRRPATGDPTYAAGPRARRRGLLVDAADVDRGLPVRSPGPRCRRRSRRTAPRPRPARGRGAAPGRVDGDEPWRAASLRLLAAAGLTVAGDREPRRPGCWSRRRRAASAPTSTRCVRAGAPHLLVTHRRAASRSGRSWRRARPPACAAWTPTSATPTRGTRWSSSSTRRPAGRAVRPGADAARPGLGGARPGHATSRASRPSTWSATVDARPGPDARAPGVAAAPALRLQLGRRAGRLS